MTAPHEAACAPREKPPAGLTAARETAQYMLELLFAPPPGGRRGPGHPRARERSAPPERGTAAASPGPLPLATFQEEGLRRVRAVIGRRGGAILADSVGLGKTFVAVALAREVMAGGGDAVVVVPASLRPEWRRQLVGAEGSGRWQLLSHTRLALGPPVPPPTADRVMIVDEAHRFRNPGTLRYAALARLIAAGGEVLMLTATPINNGIDDLYHLVRLFAADDAFRDVGAPSLKSAFVAAAASGPEHAMGSVRSIIRAVVVRRTRRLIRDRFEDPAEALASGRSPAPATGREHSPLRPRFPRRAEPRLVRYSEPGLPERVDGIGSLELTAYSAWSGSAGDQRGDGAAALVRLNLLKRLDSSPAAFHRSVERLEQALRATSAAARDGRLLLPAELRATGDEDPLQLTLLELVTMAAPPGLDLRSLVESVDRDLERLKAMSAAPASGAKAAALRELLERTHGERTLLFTEYRDTAESLWRALAPSFRVGRVDGSGSWLGLHPAGRRVVVERFAPRANNADPPATHERVDVLIATDVLAEGTNLQDARHVVSYDLPWNPVRLLQRIGRVDRLGSPHDEVVPYLFVPRAGAEAALGLRSRLVAKLGSITDTVGAEAGEALLGRLASDGTLDRHRRRGLEELLERVESTDADPRERLRTLWVRHRSGATGPPDAATRRRPPIGVARVPPDHPVAALEGVVLVRSSAGTHDLLEAHRDGTVQEASARATAVMELALDSAVEDTALELVTEGVGRQVRRLRRRVRRHLSRTDEEARCGVRPALVSGGAAAALGRRIRQMIAAEGVALGPRAVERADRVLERLAVPLQPAEEVALDRLETGPGAELLTLLEQLESLLANTGPIRPPILRPHRAASASIAAILSVSIDPVRHQKYPGSRG